MRTYWTHPDAVVNRIAAKDESAASLARHLIDTGWQVTTSWGPQQMDVWMLVLTRGAWQVEFGVERGFSNGVAVWRDTETGERDTVACRSLTTLRELLDLIPR